MKAIGYIRQSKERKDRESISPDTQREKMNQYAIFDNDEIINFFQDIDISGFRVHYSKREGLNELFDFIKDNPDIKKVYVYAFSRLSRRIKEFIEIVDMFEEQGISVVSVTEKLDMSTPQGRLFRNILLSFNEYYSDSLSSTIIDNHRKNMQLGKWNGGNVPYGFNWDKFNRKFLPNDDFIYLMEIKDRVVNEGWGPKKISNNLNKRKIKGPSGGTWYSQTVKYILQNSFYRGFLQYDNQLYNSLSVEAVITNEEWEIIQGVLSKYDQLGPNTKLSPHLLTGLMTCGNCGSRFEIRYNGSTKARRYICSGRQYNQGEKCNSHLIDADSIESAIIEHIQQLLESSYFDEIIDEGTKSFKPKENSLKSEIRKLEVELSKIVQAQEDLYEETFMNKLIKKERFYEFNDKFEIQREALENEIRSMSKELKSTDIAYIVDYQEALSKFISVFYELEQDDQRTLIHSFIDKIIIDSDHIRLMLPISTTKIKSTSIVRGTMFFN